MTLWARASELLFGVTVKVLAGPAWMMDAILAATASLVTQIAVLVDAGLVQDLSRVKEGLLRRLKLGNDLKSAQVRQRMAEVVKAENEAAVAGLNDRISRAEEAKKLAEAAKTSAEAKAILLAAESAAMEVKARALSQLMEALRVLNEGGGAMLVGAPERGADANLNDVFKKVDHLSLGKAAHLVKAMEARWGVPAAEPVAVAAAPAGGGVAFPAGELKPVFSVVLKDGGANKINVIKVVRVITGLGLKEAKALVDEAPKPVKEGVSKDEAEMVRKLLADAGAVAEVR